MSVQPYSIEPMFESLVEIDPAAGESALIERIAELERIKSAAAAGQVRAAATLDSARRAREAAAGVPAAQRGRGVASEVALARRDSPVRGGVGILASRKPLRTRCLILWRRWNAGHSRSGGPP